MSLVVRQLDVDVLAGNPVLARNDVTVRPSNKQIIIGGADIIYYGTDECKASVASCKIPARLSSCREITWSYTPCDVHCGFSNLGRTVVGLSGRGLPPRNSLCQWSSARCQWYRCEHMCHARQITPVPAAVDPGVSSSWTRLWSVSNTLYSTEVPIDPDICLTKIMSDRFKELHSDFNDVFDINPSLYIMGLEERSKPCCLACHSASVPRSQTHSCSLHTYTCPSRQAARWSHSRSRCMLWLFYWFGTGVARTSQPRSGRSWRTTCITASVSTTCSDRCSSHYTNC